MLSSKQLTLVQSVPKENRPCHIGVIMDGNGRWAEKKKLPQGQGHRAGGQAIEKIIDACLLFEIPVLTLYAFSTENWNRPQSEVTNLMQILREYIEKHASKVIEKDIRFRTLGDISVLDADIYKNLSIIEKKSKNKKKMTLCLAINYGGRDEIVRATKKILQDFKLGKITSTQKQILQFTFPKKTHYQQKYNRNQSFVGFWLLNQCLLQKNKNSPSDNRLL